MTPDLTIDIFLDHSLTQTNRGNWVGFTSDRESVIRHLASVIPAEMQIVEVNDIPSPSRIGNIFAEYFTEPYMSDLGMYFKPGAPIDISRCVRFLCDVIRTIPGYENSGKLDDVTIDINAIESDPFLSETTKKQLIDARIGQGGYRQRLEELWDYKCAVLGITNKRVLRASHVKPWRHSTDKERLDPNNGLLLTAHVDALFDAGLITFASSGEMIISDKVSQSDLEILGLGARLRRSPSAQLEFYLKHHRREFSRYHGGLEEAD